MLTGEDIMSHWLMLFRMARLKLPRADPSTWEDLASATVERAYRNRHRYQPDARNSPAMWLTTIHRNVITDYVRRAAVHPFVPLTNLGRATTDAGSERHADHLYVRAILAHLKPSQRIVIEHRYYDSLTASETAAALGTTEQAVKKLQARAIKKLRSVLEGV